MIFAMDLGKWDLRKVVLPTPQTALAIMNSVTAATKCVIIPEAIYRESLLSETSSVWFYPKPWHEVCRCPSLLNI